MSLKSLVRTFAVRLVRTFAVRYGAVGDTAKATAERRCRRSARRPAALPHPPGVASRVGEAAPRLPEPLGLRGWRLSVLPPQLQGLLVAGDDLGNRRRPPVACVRAQPQRVVHGHREGRHREDVRARAQPAWLEVTGPIVEAFFHAHYFLEMAVRYGKQLQHPPRQLPSGWAAFLYLYNLRLPSLGVTRPA